MTHVAIKEMEPSSYIEILIWSLKHFKWRYDKCQAKRFSQEIFFSKNLEISYHITNEVHIISFNIFFLGIIIINVYYVYIRVCITNVTATLGTRTQIISPKPYIHCV